MTSGAAHSAYRLTTSLPPHTVGRPGYRRPVIPATAWPWSPPMTDQRAWVAASDDPGARWALLTGVLDLTDDAADVTAARAEMLAHPSTADLLDRLQPWDSGAAVSGHNSPAYAPNLLNLLADRGLRAGDDARVDALLEQMLAHQEPSGRFPAYAPFRGDEQPVWGAQLCDHHAILDVLIRYGHGEDPRVRAGVDRMMADLTETTQGRAWPCLPHPVTGFRGPGRKAEMCPQVAVEALRALGRLPEGRRPPGLLDVGHVLLGVWRARGAAKPYMFGHGKTFKTTKWPVTWYGAHEVLDALGRYPHLWSGPDADPEDRRSMAELAACLIAYNADDNGRVVPRSVFRGFETHSFGQKKQPSAFATAMLLTVLHRLDDLAPDAATVDVTALTSSKGGTGTALPPPGVVGR